MNVQQFPLAKVKPNPFQVRLSEDEAHVAGLAEDIQARGLLQIPTGRQANGGTVELAFGHSRLAAYQRLASNGGGAAFAEFPVVLRELTDRQMSDLAAAENARRKNLSPIETASALQRRIEAFGLTQAEAGQPFGLGASAVSNLLRLLKLPAPIRDQVHGGELPERLARQLVNVAQVDEDEARAIGQRVAKADPSERERELERELMGFLEERGNTLGDAPWDMQWLAKTTPADDQARALGVEVLRACQGCPHCWRREWEDFCTLPACFEAKVRLHVTNIIDRASGKLKIPAAAEGEAPEPLLNDYDWQNEARARKLIKAFPDNPGLQLRLIQAPEPHNHWKDVIGSAHVGLGTLAPKQVQAWLKANPVTREEQLTHGAPAVKPNGAQTAAAGKDQAQAEREAAARRAERADRQRALHDCAWLVQSVTPVIAKQLALSGSGLAYVVARVQNPTTGGAARFPGLEDWLLDLEEAAEGAKGKERDRLLRELLVAGEIVTRVMPPFEVDYRIRDGSIWRRSREELHGLATKVVLEMHKTDAGFGVKLPAGWDKPPVHRTPWNCWHCGRFTGAERVTKRDQEEDGWIVLGDPAQPDGVWCGEAHRAEFVKVAGKTRKRK